MWRHCGADYPRTSSARPSATLELLQDAALIRLLLVLVLKLLGIAGEGSVGRVVALCVVREAALRLQKVKS